MGHGWLYGLLYNVFMLSLLIIIISRNLLFFLFFWEITTLTSYFLIIWEYYISTARRAGYSYFIFTHVLSTLPLTIAIFLIHIRYHTLDITLLRSIEPFDIVLYALLIIGCGSKTGIFPFHFWMPEAQLAALSSISALISSGMNNVALYVLIRLLYLSSNVYVGYVIAGFRYYNNYFMHNNSFYTA